MIPRRWAEADTQGGAEKPSPSLRQSLRQPPRGIGRTAAVRRSRGAERRQPAPGGKLGGKWIRRSGAADGAAR
jgi:hypothetical protein